MQQLQPLDQHKERPKVSTSCVGCTITTTSAHSDPQQLQGEIASLSSQLEEARDEAELNLLMLQQAQEELEFYFLAHQQQEQLLQSQQLQLERAEALIQALLERLEQQG